MRKGENLSGVGERNRSHSHRVERREQKDEQRDDTNTCCTDVVGDEETETCGKERPSHMRESNQQQATATNYDEGISQLFDANWNQNLRTGIDGDKSRESEQEVDSTEAKRGVEGLTVAITSFGKHCRWVKSNNWE